VQRLASLRQDPCRGAAIHPGLSLEGFGREIVGKERAVPVLAIRSVSELAALQVIAYLVRLEDAHPDAHPDE
jgi:hypothetical protein